MSPVTTGRSYIQSIASVVRMLFLLFIYFVAICCYRAFQLEAKRIFPPESREGILAGGDFILIFDEQELAHSK